MGNTKGGQYLIMKTTGMIRKVDELGRVVIPIELRRTLGIQEKDPIEIYVEDDQIVLQKHTSNTACSITGKSTKENISLADGKLVLSPQGAQTLVEEISANFDLQNQTT